MFGIKLKRILSFIPTYKNDDNKAGIIRAKEGNIDRQGISTTPHLTEIYWTQ